MKKLPFESIRSVCLAVSLAFVAMSGNPAMAALVINVDFDVSVSGNYSSTYSGTGAAPDAGTTWNGFQIGGKGGPATTSLTSGALVTSTGNATSVTVTLTNFARYETASDGQPAPFAPGLLNDFAWDGSDQTAFSIAGLVNGGSYDLYLYSQNGGYNSETTNFIINATTKTAAFNAGNLSGFVENGNYVKYSSVVATGGTINGSWNTSGAPNSSFNGFQIVAVPEPSTWVLLAGSLGTIMLLRKRRRA